MPRFMKIIPVLVASYGLAAASLAQDESAASSAAGARDTLSVESNQIVAKINKAIITRRDVEREIWDFLRALESDPLKSTEEKLQEYQFNFILKLREMIGEMLTAQLGRESGFTISEELIEERLRERADEVEGLPRLVEVLSEKGLTLDDMRKSIEQDAMVQEVLFTGAGFKASKDLEIPPLDTYIGPGEIYDYYVKHKDEFRSEAGIKVSLILVGKRAHGARAKARAEEAHRRLLGGESFSKLAVEFSDHALSAKAGGKLSDGEWMAPGENLPAFESVIWGLPTGGTSGIIDTPGGIAILRIDDKQEAKVATFEDVQDRVRSRLQEARLRENFGRIQRILVENAYIWPENLVKDERSPGR